MAKSIWQWLEIKPTTDKSVIKAAYAEAAKKYHPSEHPVEFQELRRSYKEAIQRAEWSERKNYSPADEDESKEEIAEIEETLEEEEAGSEEAGQFHFFECLKEYDFSERQNSMLEFFVQMAELMALRGSKYVRLDVFQLIYEGWESNPYENEITPDFAAVLVETLVNIPGIPKEAYDCFEKNIIRGRKTGEWTAVYSRFSTIKSGSGCHVEKDKKGNHIKIFDEYSEKKGFRLSIGHLTPNGFGRIYNKQDFLCNKHILIDLKNGFKKYLWEDLRWHLNPRNDELTVMDYTGRTVIKLTPEHGKYMSFLTVITTTKCVYLGETEFDWESFATKMSPDENGNSRILSNPLIIEPMKRRTKWIFMCMGIGLAGFAGFSLFYMVSRFMRDTNNTLISYVTNTLAYVFLACTFLSWAVWTICLYTTFDYLISIARIKINHKEIDRMIEFGLAWRIVGGRCFVIGDYLIMNSGLNMAVLLTGRIKQVSLTENPLSKKRTLTITQTKGQTYILNTYDYGWPDLLCEKLKEISINYKTNFIVGR